MIKLSVIKILILTSIFLGYSCEDNEVQLNNDNVSKQKIEKKTDIFCNLYYTIHLTNYDEINLKCIDFIDSKARLKIEIVNNLDSTITYDFQDFSKANMGTSMYITLNDNDTIDIYRKFETRGIFKIENGKTKTRDFDLFKDIIIKNYSDIKDEIELIKNGKNQKLHLSNYQLKIPVKKHNLNFIWDCEFILESEIEK